MSCRNQPEEQRDPPNCCLSPSCQLIRLPCILQGKKIGGLPFFWQTPVSTSIFVGKKGSGLGDPSKLLPFTWSHCLPSAFADPTGLLPFDPIGRQIGTAKPPPLSEGVNGMAKTVLVYHIMSYLRNQANLTPKRHTKRENEPP